MDAKKKKVRVAMRRNMSKPPRGNDITRQYAEDAAETEDATSGERVRAKGDLSRHRTITIDADTEAGMPGASASECLPGRVFKVHGLYSYIELSDGRTFRCTVRRLLKSLMTDERSIVTTGDNVWVRPGDETTRTTGADGVSIPEGVIEKIESRHGVLTRASRRREHVLVANVDQLAIVVSLVEPDLKPHLIDRYIAAAEKGQLKPILCLNKIDKADPVELQPMVGAYSQLGIPTILTSAKTGMGIPRLIGMLRNRATVFSGQSGVGKSSLLNAIEPGLALRVKAVSEVNHKGKHTTTTAELIRLETGGWVVDTPGVRQLQLWDVKKEEIEGFFREFRPYVRGCRFPDCTHTHEIECAVKVAVRKQFISERRYLSYLGMYHGNDE